MILDRRNWERGERWRITLDGVEINAVLFADTDAGILKTFDIFHDGAIATGTWKGPGVCWKASDFPGREIETPLDGVLVETLREK